MYQISDFRRYFNVVAFDNRGGTGQTDKPAGQYSIKVMAEDAISLMDHLGIRKAHIIGHSMGGCIAQEIAINNPGRVLTLVLTSTWARYGQLDNRFSPELKAAYELPAPEMVERVTKLALNSPLMRFFFVKIMMYQAQRNNSISEAGIHGQVQACLEHRNADRLRDIKVPTLVIHGTKDRCVLPASSRELVKLIPAAKVVEIKNGSHTLMVEKRKAFNKAVLDFLLG